MLMMAQRSRYHRHCLTGCFASRRHGWMAASPICSSLCYHISCRIESWLCVHGCVQLYILSHVRPAYMYRACPRAALQGSWEAPLYTDRKSSSAGGSGKCSKLLVHLASYWTISITLWYEASTRRTAFQTGLEELCARRMCAPLASSICYRSIHSHLEICLVGPRAY